MRMHKLSYRKGGEYVENRRKRAKVGAGKTRNGESDVDREMKGD